MISTATAASKASARMRRREPAGERREREHDHDGNEDGGHAVGEPLHRRLAGLGLGDEPRDLRERRLGADTRRTNDEPPVRVDRRAGHPDAGRHLDGHGLAGQQRLVDRGLAFLDDAVRRDLLAGPHDEEVADLELGRRHELLTVAEQRASFAPSTSRRGSQRPPRARASSQRPSRISVVIDGGDLEVRLGLEPRNKHHGRPAPGCERADRDERVHRRRAVAKVAKSRPVELERLPRRPPGLPRRAHPLPAVELRRGASDRERDGRRVSASRQDEAAGRAALPCGRHVLVREHARGSRLLDGATRRAGSTAPSRRRPSRARSRGSRSRRRRRRRFSLRVSIRARSLRTSCLGSEARSVRA